MGRRTPASILIGLVLAVVVVGGFFLLNNKGHDAGAAANPGATAAASASKAPVTAKPGRPSLSSSAAPTPAQTGLKAPAGLDTVNESALPAEAKSTLKLIRAGGPYPYSRDGVVFSNFERVLPKQPSGYYHEYTVKTPGANDRGARRLVVGQSNGTFYTDDHYASFRFVVEGK